MTLTSPIEYSRYSEQTRPPFAGAGGGVGGTAGNDQSLSLRNAELGYPHGKLSARRQQRLAEDVAHVTFDGGFSNHQLLGKADEERGLRALTSARDRAGSSAPSAR
jgi:hypothetical protein